LAVFKAVSARPFLAPCVDIKYSSTSSPSLKLDSMGVSIISPDGLAINPLIPASCLICWAEPLAPESAIMNIGLNEAISSFVPSGFTGDYKGAYGCER